MMLIWTRNLLFLLLVATTLEDLGLLGSGLYRLFALLSFLGFVATFRFGLRRMQGVTLARAVVAALFVLAGVAVAAFGALSTFHLFFFLAISVAALTGRSDAQETHQFRSYVVALGAIGALAELVRVLPSLWHFKMTVASSLCVVAETIAREDRTLGPTAMGLPLLTALIVLVVVREGWSERGRRLRMAVGVCVVVLAHIAYLVLLKYFARWVASGHPVWQSLLLNSQVMFVLLGVTAFTLFDRGRAMRPLAFRRRVWWPAAAATAAGLVVALTLGWSAPPPRRSARVMIYDAGYVNWEIPIHGKYGERSAGMFGMLPSALEAAGFDVIVSDDLALLDRSGAPDCVVMINIQQYLQDDDKDRVWRFIDRGGGLLCLGDHTGVAGIRGPFNDLLEPVGIRFLFDSSTFFGEGWNDALECRVHPLNRGVTTAEDFQIWVGATLDLDLGARPVVVGRYGYSDMGNPANIERSYLGDRRYNPDELLGDVVLVADARHGRGKVMVFGDTSGYQNLSLARTLDSVVRSLDYLCAPGGFGPGLAVQLIGLALVLLVVLGASRIASSPAPVVALALGFALGSVAVNVASRPHAPIVPSFKAEGPKPASSPIPHARRELAVLDLSHGGHYTLRAWKDNSLGGLQLNLARNGYFPLLRPEFPRRDLESGAKVLVVIAPTRSYSPSEIDAIESFLVRGGTAIVSVGFEEVNPARTLLQRFGLDVAGAPLGRFEVSANGDTLSEVPPVVIREGWPLVFDEGKPAEVLLAQWGSALALRRPVGAGEIIVIGDSSFFYDVNLETLDQYFEGNVAFLRELVEVKQAQ